MRKGRFTSAAKGLMITLVAPVCIALAQIALVPRMVDSLGLSTDPADIAFASAHFRWEVVQFYLGPGSCVLGYWLTMAVFCRADMLKIRLANACLLLSGLIFEIPIILNLVAPKNHLSERLCTVLGVREPSEVTYGFDPVSNCDLFWGLWGVPIFAGVPLVLLLASAVLRIAISGGWYTRVRSPNS